MEGSVITNGKTKSKDKLSNVEPIVQIGNVSAEKIYQILCKKIGKVIHYNGLKTLTIYENKGEPHIGMNNINPADLASLIGSKDMRETLISHVNEKYRFKAAPKIVKELYVWKPNGEMNIGYTKDNFEKEMYKQHVDVNYNTGVITIRKAFPKIKENNDKDFDSLLEMIVGKDMLPTIKSFMAQLVFEKRVNKSGRASLVLWGERGTGKGFLVEQIIKRMVPGMSVAMPGNFIQFNGFMDNKLIYFDENELENLDMMAVSKLAKRISGGVTETINRKNLETYQIDIYGYFAVMSNSKPINIAEKPVDVRDNQWVAIKMERPLNKNPDFNTFRKKHGSELSNFLENSIGSYIKNVLLPIYLHDVSEYQDYRYGFPVPLTSQLEELCDLSESNYEGEALNMLEYLYNTTINEFDTVMEIHPDRLTLTKHFKLFKEKFFLSNTLFTYLKKKFSVSSKQLKATIVKYSFGDAKSSRARINDKVVRGVDLREVEMTKLFNPTDIINHDDEIDYNFI